MKIKHGLILGTVLALASARVALADPTALELIKKGDDYVGVQSKDKVIQIASVQRVSRDRDWIWREIQTTVK